jgi:hypothetical protein
MYSPNMKVQEGDVEPHLHRQQWKKFI